MRKSLIAPVGVVTVAAIVAVFAVLLIRQPARDEASAATGDAMPSRSSAMSPYAARFVQSGAVLVSIEPVRVDERGAVFRIGFETHSVELDLDVAASAKLEVDGTTWSNPTWSGSPPGGHHRNGELTFDASGDASGRAVLSIEGLPEPVVAAWTLGE